MSLIVNPYIRSGAVPGERTIVTPVRASQVFSPLVVDGGSLAIFGERGMGKSSLLCYVADPPATVREDARFQNHLFIAFNCDIVNPVTPANFWFQTVRHLDRKIDAGPIKETCQALLARKKGGAELGPVDFHLLLDLAAGAEKRVVLALDDFDVLIATEGPQLDTTRIFLQGLRSVTTRQLNKANLVVSSRRSLEDLCRPVTGLGASPFPNGFTLYRLRVFREKEMEQLLGWVEETGQPPFSVIESTYIRHLSGHHPQLAQIAAAQICDLRLEAGVPLEDLTPVGERFKSEAHRLMQSLWLAASEVERLLLMAVALQSLEGELPARQYDLRELPVIFSQRDRELLELTERGLLVRTQVDPPAWAIFSPVFEWWLLKEIESADPEQLEDYRKVWGNLLSKRQADRLGKLVTTVRDNMDIIEKIGQTIIRMTGFPIPTIG